MSLANRRRALDPPERLQSPGTSIRDGGAVEKTHNPIHPVGDTGGQPARCGARATGSALYGRPVGSGMAHVARVFPQTTPCTAAVCTHVAAGHNLDRSLGRPHGT